MLTTHFQSFAGALHTADIDLRMTATGNSSFALSQGTCLPLAGFSVWAALPPLPDPTYSSTPARPITLVTAQLDSDGLFHDLAQARVA